VRATDADIRAPLFSAFPPTGTARSREAGGGRFERLNVLAALLIALLDVRVARFPRGVGFRNVIARRVDRARNDADLIAAVGARHSQIAFGRDCGAAGGSRTNSPNAIAYSVMHTAGACSWPTIRHS
jgi:hypothetical protein